VREECGFFPPASESAWMRLSDSKKAEVFREVLERYHSFVFRLAYSYLRDVQRTEDISQEVFLDAYRSLEKLKDYDRLSSWLKAVTRNKCVDLMKKESGKVISIDEYRGAEIKADLRRPVDGRDRIYGRETRRKIMWIIDSLPNPQRQALILRHTEHISYKEIAEMLGVTITALKSILFRARRTLRREMEGMEKRISEDVS
jgi:RNA polymerase sigma-70 factor (ECF subfamily)